MIVLAVDPGSISSGWCIIDNGRILSSGVIKLPAHKPMGERLAELKPQLSRKFFAVEIFAGVDVLVVEVPPLKSRKKNPANLRGPALAGGVWIGSVVHDELVLVEPGDWQRPMLGKRHTKETSKIRASMEAKRPIDDDNEADAVNVGIWWWRTNGCR